MKQPLAVISPMPPSAFAPGRLPRWSFQLILASALVAVLPACEGLRIGATQRLDDSHATACLKKAQLAWQVMQRENPGTMPAQKALRMYNRSLGNLVKSLREHERTTAWGREIQFGGPRPWRMTFDVSPGNGGVRTLALSEFAHCWLASDVKLHHFDRVVAQDGLGVPVVLAQDDSRRVVRPFHPPDGEFLPATAVLEFPAAVPGHPAEARLRFYNPLAVSELTVGRHSQPLAENLTAALQSSLTDATLDKKGRHEPAPSASSEEESQLFFLNRYDPTKAPVVFVPGMRCGPSVWKNSINEMFADPDLRRKYQPVCFIYPTRLPVPVSAARLRELLQRSRDRFDPGHHDAGFDRMVLVGHSMGGLLARMQVIDSGTDFWRAYFTATPREIAGQTDARTQRMLQKALFFQRQSHVKFIVFIGTPHRGSVLADAPIARAMIRLFLFLPKASQHRLHALKELPTVDINPALREFYNSGEDGAENLSTKHPFFRALARHPVAVTFHSIIATRGAADFRKSSDGLVPYWSAHLDGAASETIGPYSHGCLEKPGTVHAVMKILKQAK